MHLKYLFQTATITTGVALIATAVLASSAVQSEVTSANARSGHPDTVIANGFTLVKVAEGADPLENPSGVITNFGLLNDFPPRGSKGVAPSRIRILTLCSSMASPGQRRVLTTAPTFCFRDTKTATAWSISVRDSPFHVKRKDQF